LYPAVLGQYPEQLAGGDVEAAGEAVPESQLSASAMETALGVVHKICG
jgi:hypothetical protein